MPGHPTWLTPGKAKTLPQVWFYSSRCPSMHSSSPKGPPPPPLRMCPRARAAARTGWHSLEPCAPVLIFNSFCLMLQRGDARAINRDCFSSGTICECSPPGPRCLPCRASYGWAEIENSAGGRSMGRGHICQATHYMQFKNS